MVCIADTDVFCVRLIGVFSFEPNKRHHVTTQCRNLPTPVYFPSIKVNNAAVLVPCPFADLDLEDARSQFDTNFFGALSLTQAVIPGMMARRKGKIVNVSSMAANLPWWVLGFRV